MHERSLVKALLRQVEAVAAAHRGSRVRMVRVRLGEFSGVEPGLFASAFEDLASQSLVVGTALNLEQVPLQGVCNQCGSQFHIEGFRFQCCRCGSARLTLRGGEEILLESVTFEEAEQ